jgi:phosphoribosylformimino-5-aminoimidazole carboxamide ribotide isomerase
MQLFPSIDLRGGQVVRLTQGDFDRMDVYSDHPADIAREFREAGAQNLHVVDLDGAKTGEMVNLPAIREILAAGNPFIEVGGGIRDEARICRYLELGVARVILGTVAVDDFDFTAAMIKKYGDKIAVGVDAKDGNVAVRGWLNKTDVDALEFCQRLCDAGISTIIYTDISKDGAMAGTNLELYQILQNKLSCDITASGGISSLEELKILRDMGLYAAILGKSLYTGAIDLKEAVRLC